MGLREGRPADKPLLDIHANLYVERDSPEGHRDRPPGRPAASDVGTAARKQIEALLGTPVYLDLHVKIAKDWQRDPKQLRKLGFYGTPDQAGVRRPGASWDAWQPSAPAGS